MEYPFRNRTEAGRVLAQELMAYANRDDVIVLALPRGGVPVAFEVARALHAPLDVFVVRKLGVPGHKELAMGAIASGGIRVLNEAVVRALGRGFVSVVSSAHDIAGLERDVARQHEHLNERSQLSVRGR